MRAGGRHTEGDASHLLEGIAIVVFDQESGSIDPKLPAIGSGLRWQEFIDRMAKPTKLASAGIDGHQSRCPVSRFEPPRYTGSVVSPGAGLN